MITPSSTPGIDVEKLSLFVLVDNSLTAILTATLANQHESHIRMSVGRCHQGLPSTQISSLHTYENSPYVMLTAHNRHNNAENTTKDGLVKYNDSTFHQNSHF